MADFAPIERRDRSPCFYVAIAGVDTLFGTVQPPSRTYFVASESSGFREYQRSISIIPGRGFEFSRSLEEEDAIIESETVTMSLVCRDHIDASDSTDPGFIFGRMGFAGADFSAQLNQSIDLSQTPTVHLTTVTGLNTGDVVHIGQEAIEVGAIDTAAKTFTVPNGGRGRLGTTRSRHAVSADDGVFPLVTKPAVFFRGRRAVIYEAALGQNGENPSDSDWIERFRGFIANEPEFSTEGGLETVTLSISPMTAALDRPLAHRAGKLRLHPRIHTFDGTHCENIVFFESVDDGRYIELGITGSQQIGGATYTTLKQGTAEALDGLIPYVDNPDSDELYPFRQPRRFIMSIGVQGGGTKNAIIIDRSGDHILLRDIDGPLQNSGDNYVGKTGSVFGNFAHTEARVLSIGALAANAVAGVSSGAALWPDAIMDALTSASFDSDELEHGLFQIRYSAQAQQFSFTPNFKYTVSNPAAIEALGITVPAPPRASISIHRDPPQKARLLRQNAGGIAGWQGSLRRGDRYKNTGDAATSYDSALLGSPAGGTIPPAVINFFTDDQPREVEVQVQYDTQPATAANQSRGSVAKSIDVVTARSFFHAGAKFQNSPAPFFDNESFITFDKDPGAPAGGSVILDISNGDSDPFMQIVVGEATSVTVDGETGFVCRVLEGTFFDDETFTIIDNGGPVANRPLFSPSVRFAPAVSVGAMLLQLLTSSSGGLVTSSEYDVLPLGAGLVDNANDDPLGADVDVDSFLAISEPVGLNFSPVFKSGDTILDVMRGILLSVGYVLDMHIDDTGKCRISAVKVGIPNALSVIASLDDSDISETPVPSSPARTSIRNIFNFSSNFDASGNPGFSQEIKDTASIEAFGEADKLDVELQGAVLNLDPGSVLSVLQPIFSKLRLEMAFPYRLFRFSVRSGMAARMRVGGVYKISSGQLRGERGPGVANAVCRLRSIESDGFAPTARVEFIHFGFAGTGWAPALAVTGANGATLTVREDDYRPDTAAEDLSGFEGIQAGDVVRIIRIGTDSPFIGTVQSIDLAANTITLTSNPGISAPADGHPVHAYILPGFRSEAAEIHDDYAFIGFTRLT